MSEGNTENAIKPDSNFPPTFIDHHILKDTNFNGKCLENNICIPKKVIYIYIYMYVSYTLNPKLRNLNKDFTLNNRLFGSVKLTKNADLYKYKYSAYNR